MTTTPTLEERRRDKPRYILLVRILNFSDLLAAYGDAVQMAAERHICACLQVLQQAPIALVASWPDAMVNASEFFHLDPSDDESLCERATALLSLGPIECGHDEAFLKVETFLIRLPEPLSTSMPGDALTHLDLGNGVTPVTGSASEARKAYRNDMSLAVGLFAQLTSRSLILAFQPVVTASATKQPIYWEVFLRRQTEDTSFSEFASAAKHIRAVERLGLIERVDRSVVWTVLDLLRRHRHVSLGCNVSAQSLKHGRWWHQFFDALQERPDLGSRLIIEVTRTSAITQDADAIDILQRLQALGCKIAISDMGLGYNTLDFVITSHPDYIKIDRGRLGEIAGETPESSLRLFGNLVKLCADLTPCVVATSIENERGRTEAVDTGVHALQGYLFGRPNVLPYWLSDVAVVRDAFEPERALDSTAATREAQRKIFLASTKNE